MLWNHAVISAKMLNRTLRVSLNNQANLEDNQLLQRKKTKEMAQLLDMFASFTRLTFDFNQLSLYP